MSGGGRGRGGRGGEHGPLKKHASAATRELAERPTLATPDVSREGLPQNNVPHPRKIQAPYIHTYCTYSSRHMRVPLLNILLYKFRNLCVHDGHPELASLDGAPREPLSLVGGVEGLELVSEHVGQARSLVGAEQTPVPVFFVFFVFIVLFRVVFFFVCSFEEGKQTSWWVAQRL